MRRVKYHRDKRFLVGLGLEGRNYFRVVRTIEERPSERTRDNDTKKHPPQLMSSYCNTYPGWEEQRRGTRRPKATRVCQWASSPKAKRDLVKFLDMPPPAPKGSTELQRRDIAAHNCALVLPRGDIVLIAGTMQLVGEHSPLSRDN
jgi:hypothetical protein